jgi:CRISPR-associated protein (TIGR02710 family)
MDTFEQKILKMRKIFRGQETYGEGEPSMQANSYRRDQLMEDIISRARENSQGTDKVKLLISLSGFSPETTILAYEILKPERVVIVSSDKARSSIDVIGDAIVGKNGLKQSDFIHTCEDPTNVLNIYRFIKKQIERFAINGRNFKDAIIDITGGKKVMSATAALAAWQLDLPLCYIESDFDPEMRQPFPGSERLIRIANPVSIFGDQAISSTIEIFNSGRFENAYEKFEKLSNQISEPAYTRFMGDLSYLYKAWCDLDIDKFDDAIYNVERHLKDPRIKGSSSVSAENIEDVHAQLSFLKGLKQQDRRALLINFYILGLHYHEMGRRDFSVLLFYRAIEGCLTGRLEMAYRDFKCKKPNYSLITDDINRLDQDFKDAHKAAGIDSGIAGLPDYSLGYMNSALLLYALDDKIYQLLKKRGVKEPISRLRSLSDSRNNSILAHGFDRISPDKSNNMRRMASDLLEVFWELDRSSQLSFNENISEFISEHRESNLKELCNKLTFVIMKKT